MLTISRVFATHPAIPSPTSSRISTRSSPCTTFDHSHPPSSVTRYSVDRSASISSVTFAMISVSSASRSPASESARDTSCTSATFFCSRRSAASSERTESGGPGGSCPVPSDMGASYSNACESSGSRADLRAPGGSVHAAAAQIVLVEAFQVADLVQECLADLDAELGARLDGAGEVLAIEHDGRRLVLDVVVAAPDGAAVEAEDRRRERRLDRGQVGQIRQVRDLDPDRAHARPPLGGERGDDRIDLAPQLGGLDQHRRREIAWSQLDGARELARGPGGVAELLEREAHELVRICVVGLDRERLVERGLGLGEARQIEQGDAALVQRIAAA